MHTLDQTLVLKVMDLAFRLTNRAMEVFIVEYKEKVEANTKKRTRPITKEEADEAASQFQELEEEEGLAGHKQLALKITEC